MVSAIRADEPEAETLALFLEVSGEANGAYTYDIWFQQLRDAGPADLIEHYDAGGADLGVVLVAASLDRLQGATLDVGEVGGEQSLVVINPNLPEVTSAPPAARAGGDLSSPLAKQVIEVLEAEVNPSIAGHGGRADLVAVEDGIAYLSMSGGCQGCGLASVTLSQGIAVALRESIPEITDVVDVTDHAGGSNPYYQPAKK